MRFWYPGFHSQPRKPGRKPRNFTMFSTRSNKMNQIYLSKKSCSTGWSIKGSIVQVNLQRSPPDLISFLIQIRGENALQIYPACVLLNVKCTWSPRRTGANGSLVYRRKCFTTELGPSNSVRCRRGHVSFARWSIFI